MARGIFNISLSQYTEAPITDHFAAEDTEQAFREEFTEASAIAEECSTNLEALTELQTTEQDLTLIHEQAPQQATEFLVQQAQESFCYALGKLNISREEFSNLRSKYNVTNVAIESRQSPIRSVGIALEGIKEFIDKLILKIKDMFRAFGNIFRKAMLKLTKMFDMSKQRANVLLDKIDENKNYNIDGDRLLAVNKMFMGAQCVDGVTASNLDIKKINHSLQTEASDLVKIANTLEKIKDGKINRWEDFVQDIKNITVKAATKVKDFILYKSEYAQANKDQKIGDQIDPIYLRFMFSKVRVAVPMLGKNALEIITVPAEQFDNIKPFHVKGTELKEWLTIARDNAAKIGQFQADLEKVIAKAQSTVKAMEKVKPKSNEGGKLIVMAINILGRLSTSVVIEITSNYIDFNKAIVKLGSMLISGGAGTDSADKADLKKENEE